MQRGWDGPEALAGLMSQSLHLGSHAPPHAKAFQAPDQAWHLQQHHAMMALPHGAALPPELAHLAAAGAAPYRPAAAGAPAGVALPNGYAAAPAAPQSVGWGGQSIPENGTFKASCRQRVCVVARDVAGRLACAPCAAPGHPLTMPCTIHTPTCRPPGLASRAGGAQRVAVGVGAGGAARRALLQTACAATACAATTAAAWAARAMS